MTINNIRESLLKRRIAELEKQLEEAKEVIKGKQEKKEYINAPPRNELATIRTNKNTDFEIMCNDNVSIPVHQTVLSTCWSFFKTMMEHTCQETEDRTLKLDYESDVVELLVRDLHGQKNDFNFNQALCLLEISGIYDPPDLSNTAYERILLSKPHLLSMEDNVHGWKSARLGNHLWAKEFFAKQLYSGLRIWSIDDNDGREFDCLTSEETSELHGEIVKCRPTTEGYSDDIHDIVCKLTLCVDYHTVTYRTISCCMP